MLLKRIEALNFRNLSGKIEFSGGLNILFGENGQGKTNWLEAIHVLATTRSFKTARLQESVKFTENSAAIVGTVAESAGIDRELRVVIEGNTKTLLVNTKKETLARYVPNLNAFLFNADEMEIVRGTPEHRRRFLDSGIVSIFPAYAQTLSDFGKVIRQKNALLQNCAEKETDIQTATTLLEPWNEQLSVLSNTIHRARTRYVLRLSEKLETKLFSAESVGLRYVSSLEGKADLSDYAAAMRERLALRALAEIYAGHCLIGPQRDDVEITFDGHDIRKFGSSGQQRSALLILLLAQIEVYFAQNGEYPLFLLDDIDAELDYNRIGGLLEHLKGKTQTIVTTSKESFLERFGQNSSIQRINSGIPSLLATV